MASNKFFGAISHIGGADGDLDAILKANISDGDAAFVVDAVNNTLDVYTLVASSSLVEDTVEYSVIVPDDEAATPGKRWVKVALRSWTANGELLNKERTAIQNPSADQGDAAVIGSLAWHIADAAGAQTHVRFVAGTYDVTTNIIVPITMELRVDQGAVIDGSGDLQIDSIFDPGEFQVFDTSITVTFGCTANYEGKGTDKVHPEWWGECPNLSNDTTILNKAIAACTKVNRAGPGDDAALVIGSGSYYVTQGGLSAITVSMYAPHASFYAVANTTSLGVLLPFDYSENGPGRIIEIAAIFGDPATTLQDVTKYNVGIDITGDNADVRIGGINSLYIGIRMDGDVHEEHTGMWRIHVDTVLGCTYGIYVTSGTSADYGNEANTFDINYMAYCEQAIKLDSTAVSSLLIFGNTYRIHSLELHNRADMSGFHLLGAKTWSNRFIVDGSLIPPTGTGTIVNLQTTAFDNYFELAFIDWDLISNSAGYNIFKETSNQSSSYTGLADNDFGRSEIMVDAAPAAFPWREGDKAWNNTPSDGIAYWINHADGTPGTWKPTFTKVGSSITSSGAISPVNGQVLIDTTSGAQADTLADGTTYGQEVELYMWADNGDAVITVANHTSGSDWTLTFSAAHTYVKLRWLYFSWTTVDNFGVAEA